VVPPAPLFGPFVRGVQSALVRAADEVGIPEFK
jgi:hypothetical protein